MTIDNYKLIDLAKTIRKGHFKNIILLVGAGISTSAGIPDFRSDNKSIYNKYVKNYYLPHKECLFSLKYFVYNPFPFYHFINMMFSSFSSCKATITHHFLKNLCELNIVRRIYSQNIDGLEIEAGVPLEKLIQVHGSYSSISCSNCRNPFYDFNLFWDTLKLLFGSLDITFFKKVSEDGIIVDHLINIDKLKCYNCNIGYYKPDIVLFEESLTDKFQSYFQDDINYCDLLIIIGSSLQVQPICMLPQMIKSIIPKILINRNLVENFHPNNEIKVINDFFWLGECDDASSILSKVLFDT